MRLLRFFSRTTLLLLLLASLALNVATVTVGGVFTAVSAAVGAVTGASTVAARAAAKSTAQVATTQAAVRSTSRRVSARAARTAARGSASALAEAVPFLGAGAVAASVALDIADACATARDMHLLEAAVLPDADMGEFSCTREFGDAFDQSTTGALLAIRPRRAPGHVRQCGGLCRGCRPLGSAVLGGAVDLGRRAALRPPGAGRLSERRAAPPPNEPAWRTQDHGAGRGPR